MQSLRYFTKDEIDNLICYGKRNSGFSELSVVVLPAHQ